MSDKLKFNAAGKNQNAELSRRELLSKYGPYTAPLVVSLLCPETAYADPGMGGTIYSTSARCQADLAANASGMSAFHGNAGGMHCMVGGPGDGGGQAHQITEHL